MRTKDILWYKVAKRQYVDSAKLKSTEVITNIYVRAPYFRNGIMPLQYGARRV